MPDNEWDEPQDQHAADPEAAEPAPAASGGGAARRGRKKGGKNSRPVLIPELNEEELAKLDAIREEALFLSRDDQTCVHLCMEQSVEAAAKALGWSAKKVRGCISRPAVKLYALEYRDKFLTIMAQKRANTLTRVGCTREAIIGRYMELGLMEPDRTKGTIDGQVKALQAASALAGFTKDDPLEGKTDQELEDMVGRVRLRSRNRTAPPVQ